MPHQTLLHSPVQAVVGLLISGYILWFARRTYKNPDPQRSPWHGGYVIPRFRWTAARLSGFSVFWMFAAVLMFGVNLIQLSCPTWRPPIVPFLAVAAAVTLLLLPRRRTPPGR